MNRPVSSHARLLVSAVVLVIAVACSRAAAQAPGATSMCLGTPVASQFDRDLGTVLRDYVAGIVTSADSGNAAKRARYHLTAGRPSEVTLVTDDSICGPAAVAFEKSVVTGAGGTFDSSTVRPVYVVHAVDRYVVFGPHQRAGEFSLSIVFDSAWHRLYGFTF